MSIVLGFGCVEDREREKIKAALLEGARNGLSSEEVLRVWNDKADEYDEMPRGVAPQRYTRVYDFGDKLRFHHYNRDHAMSPDGWGLLVVGELRKMAEGGDDA
jgi:hypothetical protein